MPKPRSAHPGFSGLALAGLLMALLVPSRSAEGQEPPDTSRITITGTIYDGWTGRPVVGADVRFSGTDFAAGTDEEGAFTLDQLLAGNYLLVVTAPGYQEMRATLRVVQTGSLNIPLEPLTGGLDPTRTARIVGRVRETESPRPVEGAEVTLSGVPGFQVTDGDGRFEFSGVPMGVTELSIRVMGRDPLADDVEVREPGTLELDIRLSPNPVELEPMVVTATARDGYLEEMGFYNRRDGGYSGQVMDREFIEARAPRDLGDIFNSVPGVRVDYNGTGGFEVRMRRAIRLSSGTGCYPKLLIDDVPAEIGWLQNIPPHRVEGIEVYSGSNAPLRYNDPCGVILVWTRRGDVRGSGGQP